MKLNPYLIKSAVVAALGGLLFGFDTAVIAGTTHALSEAYRLSPGLLGMTVAIALWGGLLVLLAVAILDWIPTFLESHKFGGWAFRQSARALSAADSVR